MTDSTTNTETTATTNTGATTKTDTTTNTTTAPDLATTATNAVTSAFTSILKDGIQIVEDLNALAVSGGKVDSSWSMDLLTQTTAQAAAEAAAPDHKDKLVVKLAGYKTYTCEFVYWRHAGGYVGTPNTTNDSHYGFRVKVPLVFQVTMSTLTVSHPDAPKKDGENPRTTKVLSRIELQPGEGTAYVSNLKDAKFTSTPSDYFETAKDDSDKEVTTKYVQIVLGFSATTKVGAAYNSSNVTFYVQADGNVSYDKVVKHLTVKSNNSPGGTT